LIVSTISFDCCAPNEIVGCAPIPVVYGKYNAETISILPFLAGNPSIYTSNLDVARQVVAGGVQSHWIKPEDASQGLLQVGPKTVSCMCF